MPLKLVGIPAWRRSSGVAFEESRSIDSTTMDSLRGVREGPGRASFKNIALRPVRLTGGAAVLLARRPRKARAPSGELISCQTPLSWALQGEWRGDNNN